MKRYKIKIPFDGFYESLYSDIMEQAVDSQAEYLREEHSNNQENLWDIVNDNFDYKDAKNIIVQSYVDAFNEGLPFDFEFIEMTSPREYNFETDCIFCCITYADIKTMFERSKQDEHATLEQTIKRRFTSYDGFISFYSNNLSDWLEKPLNQWDSNELGTLLLAFCELENINQEKFDLYYQTQENSDITECFNWENLNPLYK